MNTDPNSIKILCYGDSNTWGQKPDRTGRYAADVRWTGVLQSLLGDKFYVIEEGLGSRTTDLDYDRKPGRNGKTYLIPCLVSHTPIDIVVLMLGTNDLKIEYGRSAEEIALAINGLVADIKQYAQDKNGATPKIILVSPIHINDKAPSFYEFYKGYYDERSMQESHRLASEVSQVADETNCIFIDAATVSKPGEDGIHFSLQSEAPFAELLKNTIQGLNT